MRRRLAVRDNLVVEVSALLFAAALLKFAVAVAYAGEPSVKLAMISYHHSPAQQPSARSDFFAASLLHSSTAASRDGDEARTLELIVGKEIDFPAGRYLEKQPASNRRNPFLLLHRNLRGLGRPGVWASLQAGYGQLCCDRSIIYGSNETGWQEPGCVYLKAAFKF